MEKMLISDSILCVLYTLYTTIERGTKIQLLIKQKERERERILINEFHWVELNCVY